MSYNLVDEDRDEDSDSDAKVSRSISALWSAGDYTSQTWRSMRVPRGCWLRARIGPHGMISDFMGDAPVLCVTTQGMTFAPIMVRAYSYANVPGVLLLGPQGSPRTSFECSNTAHDDDMTMQDPLRPLSNGCVARLVILGAQLDTDGLVTVGVDNALYIIPSMVVEDLFPGISTCNGVNEHGNGRETRLALTGMHVFPGVAVVSYSEVSMMELRNNGALPQNEYYLTSEYQTFDAFSSEVHRAGWHPISNQLSRNDRPHRQGQVIKMQVTGDGDDKCLQHDSIPEASITAHTAVTLVECDKGSDAQKFDIVSTGGTYRFHKTDFYRGAEFDASVFHIRKTTDQGDHFCLTIHQETCQDGSTVLGVNVDMAGVAGVADSCDVYLSNCNNIHWDGRHDRNNGFSRAAWVSVMDRYGHA